MRFLQLAQVRNVFLSFGDKHIINRVIKLSFIETGFIIFSIFAVNKAIMSSHICMTQWKFRKKNFAVMCALGSRVFGAF